MTDILLDFDNKTMFANGDIRTGFSDDQNKRLLIECEKGSLKEFPDTCVGAATYLESEDAGGLIREIQLQFSADGMRVNKVALENTQLIVDANY